MPDVVPIRMQTKNNPSSTSAATRLCHETRNPFPDNEYLISNPPREIFPRLTGRAETSATQIYRTDHVRQETIEEPGGHASPHCTSRARRYVSPCRLETSVGTTPSSAVQTWSVTNPLRLTGCRRMRPRAWRCGVREAMT